ncbi:tRNA(Ile)-lysidine synthase [Candidatus Nasuia deltocephalinicola]|nr:tRNA(Ile)-lysidine synthase [Candidatus Nasuia deltocephalinicola]
MFNIKNIFYNIFIYKIYKNLRNSINKEKISILYSNGIDSNILLKSIINVIGKKNILLLHINHNISKLDKKYIKKCISVNIFLKIKLFILNLNKNNLINLKENKSRIKREKILKIFSKKLNLKTFWTGYNLSDKIETKYINHINNINKNNIKNIKKNIYYINKLNLIQKKKPFKNIKKKYMKNIFLKKIKWIEEILNLKKKNIRNVIRINFLSKIKYYKRCGWEV